MTKKKQNRVIYPKTIKFELDENQTKCFTSWREYTEKLMGKPLEVITIAFTISKSLNTQIIVKPAKYEDLKLKGIAKTDGTFDEWDEFEELIEEYDNLGFCSTLLKWNKLGIIINFCEMGWTNPGTSPKCFIRLIGKDYLIPISVCNNPEVLIDNPIVGLFGYRPIEQKILKKIKRYIEENMDAILKHWKGKSDSHELLEELTPVDDF